MNSSMTNSCLVFFCLFVLFQLQTSTSMDGSVENKYFEVKKGGGERKREKKKRKKKKTRLTLPNTHTHNNKHPIIVYI